jgi:hypothetical protein
VKLHLALSYVSPLFTQTQNFFQTNFKFGGITRWRILGTAEQKSKGSAAEVFLLLLTAAAARFVVTDNKQETVRYPEHSVLVPQGFNLSTS